MQSQIQMWKCLMTTSSLTSLGKTVFVVIEQLSHDLNFITGKELSAVCSVECECAMFSSLSAQKTIFKSDKK